MAFTYIQLYGFYDQNRNLLNKVLNDMEREIAGCFYGESSPPTDHEKNEILAGVAAKFKKPLNAAISSLCSAKDKIDQRYRLARDFDLFAKDSLAFLPISRTQVVWALCKKGFRSIEQLRIATDKELRAVPGVGKTVLAEIRTAIELHDDKIAPRPAEQPTRSPKPKLSRKAINRVSKRERARLQPSLF